MRQISLIRHAETLWNLEGRVQGHSDVPLSARGRQQAEALRRRFQGAEVLVYSSPLARALQTAELAFPGRAITYDARLKEVDFGSFEGHTLAERLASPHWTAWSQNAFTERAPGGESYAEVRARAVAWLKSLPEVPHVVAVTHSGTIQMLLSYVLGVEHPRWRKRFHLKHTGVTCLVVRDGELLIERVNDFGHLGAAGLQGAPVALEVADALGESEAQSVLRDP
jgi:alpha-ribazole phosphatase